MKHRDFRPNMKVSLVYGIPPKRAKFTVSKDGRYLNCHTGDKPRRPMIDKLDNVTCDEFEKGWGE